MTELRQLWHFLDENGINIRARYVRSTTNIWADQLSRHFDNDDWLVA
jgi:hypothetical protein